MPENAPKKAAPRKRAAPAPKVAPRNLPAFLPPQITQGFEAMAAASVNVRDFTGDLDIVEKAALVGRRFIVIGWKWHVSEFDGAGEFVTVILATEDGEKLAFNDGGTGIGPALHAAEDEGGNPLDGGTSLYCPRGLRASHYEGPAGPAVTYYFG